MSKELVNVNQNNGVTTTEMSSFEVFRIPGQEVVGLESLNTSDIKLPKVKLMQQTSLEVSKSKGKILGGQFTTQ